MESSPQSNHPPIDARDARVIAHIDATLAEYDHQRVIEESNWADLQMLVTTGDLTEAEAERRYIDWFNKRR